MDIYLKGMICILANSNLKLDCNLGQSAGEWRFCTLNLLFLCEQQAKLSMATFISFIR